MEISRWRQPPVAPAKKNRAPEGRRTITDAISSLCGHPYRGSGKLGAKDRWLAPPANIRQPSGLMSANAYWVHVRPARGGERQRPNHRSSGDIDTTG